MKVRRIRPIESSFNYNPIIGDLCLAIGLQFYYSYDENVFELNQNPFGDPDLVPIHNVEFNADNSQLNFEANYQGSPQQFEIAATFEPEKILLQLLARLHGSEFTINSKDIDTMQLIFEKGKIRSIEMYKHSPDYDILESLNVAGEDGKISLVIPAPWRRVKLKTLEIKDGLLICSSTNEQFIYKLDVRPYIVNTIEKLIEGTQ